MESEVSRDLFLRSEDINWDAISLICCGSKSAEEFPETHKQVFDLINVFRDKKLTKYLTTYFSIAIDCYKNREEAVFKVFTFLSSVLHLGIKSNGNQIIGLLESEPKLKTKLVVFNKIFELLKDNFKHLSLNQIFDFQQFIQKLLETEDKNEELICKCFDLILQIDYQLIGNEDQLKQIILKSNPRDEDSEELFATKTQFFVTLFEVYFKARKAIKLHQILSDISVDLNLRLLDKERQLYPLYGRSILELPFGQSFELWKIFLDKFDVKNKFFIKLLPIFLQHIRCLDDCLPNHLRPQMETLLNDTKQVLKTSSSKLRSDDSELFHLLLELYFSFQSIIILQMTYTQNYLTIDSWSEKLSSNEWHESNEWNDLSLIYDFTKKSVWKLIFDQNIDNFKPEVIRSLLKCLIQKFQFLKVIEYNLELNDKQKANVNDLMDQLVLEIVQTFAENHLNAFTLQQINAIIRHLNPHHLLILTDSLTSQVNEDNSEEQGFDVKRLLHNGFVWESIEFQTAFVGSFWKQIASKFVTKKRKLNEDFDKIDQIFDSLSANNSFWFKYATLSPNMKKLNEMWSKIADLSTQTEQLIESIGDKTNKKVKIGVNLMEMFVNCVPLEYLLPANQMRCLLSLSLLLFSIDLSDQKKHFLVDFILNSILRIFNGVRSVWFFSFVNPSVYFINVLKVLKNYENHEKLRTLMTKFVENIFRNTEQIEDLKNKVIESEDQIRFEFLVMIETIILKRSLHVLNMISVPKNLEKIREFCGPLSHQLSNTIHNQIKTQLLSETNVESLNSIIIIDSFAAVFEFQVSKSSSDEETIHLKTRWRKLLSKLIHISVQQLMEKSTNESCVKFLAFLCSQRKKLANILPEFFILSLWQVLCPVSEESEDMEEDTKDIKLIDILNKSQESEQLFENICLKEEENRNQFLETISDQNLFAEVIKPLVIALVQCSSAEEFEEFLKTLINELKVNDYSKTSFVLKLWIAVFGSDFHLNEEKNRLFQKSINDLLSLCTKQNRKCNQNDNKLLPEFQLNIKVPVLLIMRSVLHITKNVITSPQIFLTYHSCIDARPDLYLNEPKVFTSLFEAIYSVLNECLLKHKYIVISSMSSFNLIVQKLMQTLMTVSEEQKFINYEPIVRHDLEICSKNMDRLLTLMASLGTDYSIYAPHLITSYVIQTESVSVHLIVKKNIISGINRLLKVLSGSNAIEMIYCRLNESSRKIFKMIFDNYEKYYKFKGQI